MEANPNKLKHQNAFNVSAISIAPQDIAAEIKKIISEFSIDYRIDPIRQAIADSWSNKMNDSAAREEWDWHPKYDLESMTKEMINKLTEKLTVK